MDAPQALAGVLVGEREGEPARQPALERGIDRGAEVGGEHRDAFEGVESLQQVVDLEVGVAIDRGPDLGALGEQRVGLVEQQHDLAVLAGVEDRR